MNERTNERTNEWMDDYGKRRRRRRRWRRWAPIIGGGGGGVGWRGARAGGAWTCGLRARTGVEKPNKILNLTIVKYPTGLGYESYYDFYLYVNLGGIRPAAILTSLVKLGGGRNAGGRKGCDKNNWNADWLPSFDDTKIIVAKGVAWGLKIPFIENDATDAGAMALES